MVWCDLLYYLTHNIHRIKDNLGPNLEHVENRIEEAKKMTYQAMKTIHDEDLRKLKDSFAIVIEEGW